MNDRHRISNWIVAMLLALLVVLCLTSMRFNAPTSDEPNHISRGYYYLVTGKLDLNLAPPFVNALSGLPLLFHTGIILPNYDPVYRKDYVSEFATKFVWVYNDAESVINSGRLTIILVSVLLGYFVFRWARELWGLGAGLLALFLYVLDPNILAHSQLVTTDLGITGLIFVATYSLWRFLQRRRTLDLVLAGALSGLALATKFSALLLLPIFGVIVLMEILFVDDSYTVCSAHDEGHWPRPAPLVRLRHLPAIRFFCLALVILFSTAFLVMWASYRFETRSLAQLSNPQFVLGDKLDSNPVLRKLANHIVQGIPVPFPTYLRGISWLRRYAQRDAPSFLAGSYSTRSWWYYTLVAFVIKTPVPTLLLLAVAVYGTIRQGVSLVKREHILYVPVIAFFLVSFFVSMRIHYRHVLPVLPFLFVIISKVVKQVGKRWVQIFLALLCLWYAIASARIYPHYLAYFNEIAGGPNNGYKYLVDSDLDWGQDLKNLKNYLDARGIQRIYLSYFGTADASYYGIDFLPMPDRPPVPDTPSAYYAISATNLQGVYGQGTGSAHWLAQYTPVDKVGYSIFIYRLP